MTNVWTIAHKEFSIILKTWTGYLIAAMALFMNGIFFNAWALGANAKLSAEVLESYFYFSSGFVMLAGVFLAIRLIAEERQQKTLLLYLTAPIKGRSLIYGKFLASLMFLTLMLVCSLHMPALVMYHGKISLAQTALGYLMLILLGSACLSITLFASSIAPNQLLAAALSGFILISFLVAWTLAALSTPPLDQFFSWIAIHNEHYRSMAQGIFKLTDVIYYLSVTLFFLECSVQFMEVRRWRG
ncbi:MAG: ABC transporter permease [Oligoflexales bacterium]